MELNLIQTIFFILFLVTAIIGFLFRVMDVLAPHIMIVSCRYEKNTYFFTEHLLISSLEVPEKWFKHFFKLPVVASSLLLGVAVSRFFYSIELPERVYSILDQLLGSDRQALISPETTLLALLLLTIHCAQRFYEMHFVSKFSVKETREFCNYLFAYIHYAAVLAALVGESEGFVRGSSFDLQWNRLTYSQLICAPILVFTSFQQLKTYQILADMPLERKMKIKDRNRPSHIVKLPRGGLFDYVSGAVEFTEAIVYLMLAIILRKSLTFYYIFFWALANETTMATFCHSYHRKFSAKFPRNRKAFIPYVY